MKMHSLNKNFYCFILLTSLFCAQASAQEALKSIQEEYYDFLSLTGITERPALVYRSLSDNVWNFNELESLEENEDGTFTKAQVSGIESGANLWQKNKLGTTFTIWKPSTPAENIFTDGLKQGLYVRLYGPEWYNSYNTEAPYGMNDDALWQGRGYNTSLTAGIRAEGFGFELTFKPQLCFSQNKEFAYISPAFSGDNYSGKADTYGYFQGGIDLPQRFGDKAFWTYSWGDSEIRWTWHTLTFGFGTQNAWLGPAFINPIMGSNNAEGFPKFDAGFRQTDIYIPFTDIYVGKLEGRLWTGKLYESDYFDNNSENDISMINGLSVAYSPSLIKGITFSANRIFITKNYKKNYKYLLRLFGFSSANDVAGDGEDQKASLGVRYAFPEAGFETYGEFGFDDFSSHIRQNPFHTGVYTVGIKQAVPLPEILSSKGIALKLNLELNNFEMSQDFQMQWQYTGFYSHGKLTKGFTNKGQTAGAGSGWHGNSQFLSLNFFYPKGNTEIYFHRYCPDNNYIYNKAVNANAAYPSEISLQYYGDFFTYMCTGINTNFFVTKNILLNFETDFMSIYNFNYASDKYIFSFRFAGGVQINL